MNLMNTNPGQHALEACGRYWSKDAAPVAALPLVQAAAPQLTLPPVLRMIELPGFAQSAGINGALAVPEQYCPASGHWAEVDWPGVMAWFVYSLAERAHEAASGPIHSYSFRLHGWDSRLWERAWVNRIALFLRLWAADVHATDPKTLLGPLPEAEITLTHDVDAVRKTFAIRGKQAAFHLFNGLRALRSKNPHEAMQRVINAFRFFFAAEDDWSFEQIARMDEAHGLQAIFFFAGLPAPAWWQSPREWLIDPQYDVRELENRLRDLQCSGHSIGLHPSCRSWNDPTRLAAARKRVNEAAGMPVSACRQHWLMFSFARTWEAQYSAGLREDYTMGFNDRPGFRNGAALRFNPPGVGDDFTCTPLVLMDSHVHDYAAPDGSSEGEDSLRHVVNEVLETRGQASVLWHPHTVTGDYGWRKGFELLLASLRGSGDEVPAKGGQGE